MKKVSFTSLGCQRNLVDTEIMMGIVLKNGFELTSDLKKSDYLIVNTCAFLKEARDEVLSVLDNIFQVKKKSAKVIVTGCMVKNFKALLQKKYPQIFYFLGNFEEIALALKTQEKEQAKIENFRFISTKPYAYLKIAEGCLKNCSYCLIPKIKGPLRSKPKKQIIKEFKSLLNKNISEIILIAQDLGDYGKDFKEKNALENLLKDLLKIKKDFSLRLLYLYPDSLSRELVNIIKSDKRVCHYLDIPLQHINDDILKKMRRNTSKKKIYDLLSILRKNIPDIVIRTSLIVGFPGETERQFLELIDFLKKAQLDHVGIFVYSREKGTLAYKMKDQINPKIKQERAKKLYEIQKNIVIAKNKKMVGKKLKVFIEKVEDSKLLGRYWGQAPDIDSSIIVNYSPIIDALNKPYLVEITSFDSLDLVGYVIKKL